MDKRTFRTDCGIPGNEWDVTLYNSLKGNTEVEKAIKSLSVACEDIRELMRSIENTNPEYHDTLLELRKKMIGARTDLNNQFNGYIQY